MDRTQAAKVLFTADALLGTLSIGGAALYGAAYSSETLWIAFLPVFVPFTAIWCAFCYGAYRGLTSERIVLKIVFWLFVLGHVFAFPVGTAIAGLAIWLQRKTRDRRPAESS